MLVTMSYWLKLWLECRNSMFAGAAYWQMAQVLDILWKLCLFGAGVPRYRCAICKLEFQQLQQCAGPTA